jgi:hypothetical protein
MDRPAGSRAGSRRAEPLPRSVQPGALGLGLAALAGFVCWGVLVRVAIGFGRDARAGQGAAWVWLALIAMAAVAVMFGAMMLVASTLRRLGIIAERQPHKH